MNLVFWENICELRAGVHLDRNTFMVSAAAFSGRCWPREKPSSLLRLKNILGSDGVVKIRTGLMKGSIAIVAGNPLTVKVKSRTIITKDASTTIRTHYGPVQASSGRATGNTGL